MSLIFLDVRSKNLFESNACLLECCHAIPLVDCQSDLSCPVNKNISNIHVLKLCVLSPVNVRKLDGLFNSREYSHDQIPMMVVCLIDDVFAFKKLMGNQLTVVVLEMSQHVRNGIID